MKKQRKQVSLKESLKVPTAIIGWASFFLILSSVGYLELEVIGFKQFFVRSTIGLIFMYLSIMVSRVIFEEENNNE